MRKNGEEMITPQPTVRLRGVDVYQGFLDRAAQERLVDDVRGIITAAPLFSPMTPYGKPMSVRMTSAGGFGWVSDRTGYRYSRTHPNGAPWPEIPEAITAIWAAVAQTKRAPECCLVNFYKDTAKMGLHQDRDEADFSQPVVSISLGDDALFRIGGTTRGGPTESIWLRSGDVVVLGGDARMNYHGIDKTRQGSSTLLKSTGRINLTLRVVT